MNINLKRLVLVGGWLLSVVAATQWRTFAQGQNAEVRFRVEGTENGRPFGAFVVNHNGVWLEIGPSPAKAHPALTR